MYKRIYWLKHNVYLAKLTPGWNRDIQVRGIGSNIHSSGATLRCLHQGSRLDILASNSVGNDAGD